MKRFATCPMSALVIMLTAATALAAVPRLINYQGVLTDAAGIALEGPHDLIFSVYTDSAATTATWIETHPAVPLAKGVFSVILGGLTPITDEVFAGTQRWLGITVDAGPETAPRMRLTSVPWALRAAVADSVLGGGGPDGGWTVAGDDMYATVPGGVGIGTQGPDPSALLDLVSPSRGFLPPRLSQPERDAIADPADGLVVFNTTTSRLNYFASGNWRSLSGDCIPDCAGRVCGDDGCGGSCGSCPLGMHCENGQCVCDLDECEAGDSYCGPAGFTYCEVSANGCGHWVVESCDDANACTNDSCDPVTGCQFGALPDGTACGADMLCLGGQCVSCANPGSDDCGTAYYLGEMCGDLGADGVQVQGCGEGWFRVYIYECDNLPLPNDLTLRASLEVNPGNLYQVSAFYSPCDTPRGGSDGQSSWVTLPDNVGSDDGGEYFVEVIRVGALTTNASWTLAVAGNVGP